MATAVVSPWQAEQPHQHQHQNAPYPYPGTANVHEVVSASAAAAAAAASAAAAAAAAAAAHQAQQREHILSQPISQPSDEPVDETGKSIRPSCPTEFDPFYGRRAISELCERVIASLFECSLDSTAASMGAKGCDQRPTHRLSEFIAYALYRTRLPIQVTYQALYLLKRLKSRYPGARGSSGHRLFISALMLASKSTCDDTYSNKSWTIVGQGLFTLREVNQMERELFSYLGYRVNVPNESLQNFIDGLESGRFRTTADLLGCNTAFHITPATQAEAAPAGEAVNPESDSAQAIANAQSQPDADVELVTASVSVPAAADSATPEVVHAVSAHELPPTEYEAAQARPAAEDSIASQEDNSFSVERSSSTYLPRVRSEYTGHPMQRASIAGYPAAAMGSIYAGRIGTAMAPSLSTPGLPSYANSNSAPATCAAPVRSIPSITGMGEDDARPSSAHSHFRVLQSARDRSRPYTMPPAQNVNLHPHPFSQPAYYQPSSQSEHLQLPSSRSADSAVSHFYSNDYLSTSQCRSPSERSMVSSISSLSSSGSSYASSDSSTSTSPSLYESRSQSSGFTTPESTDMELSYSPFVECETVAGQAACFTKIAGEDCYGKGTGGPALTYEYLRSHPALMSLQQQKDAACMQFSAASACYSAASN